MNKDLTVGNPSSILWRFCMPLLGSILFQQLYNIADSLIAGKFIGENALAAVGNSYEITLIFLAFAIGCNMGCSIVVSGFFGAKEYENMKTAVYTAMISSGILCGILMVVGTVFCGSFLSMIHTPAEIFADSKLYLDIYIWGLPFCFFYNMATGIFSALGDSKTPFWFLAFSSTANIFVDILFVAAFDMGVAGVAWATFLCQGISCVLAVFVIFRRLSRMKTKKKAKLFDVDIFKKFVLIAGPSILQQSSISFGNIVIQGVINGFGPAVIAGYAAAIKLNNLVITSFTTLSNGISNYAAQNIGAGKVDRISQGWKAGIKMVWMLTIPVALLYFFGGKGLVAFFMNEPSELAVSSGLSFLRIVVPFYFVVSVKIITDGFIRGAGLMKYFMISTFVDLLLRVFFAVFFAGIFGYVGIWSAWPIGWVVGAVLTVGFYQKEFGR